jgi:glycerophosphoryl diester phosphodiesterase
MGAMGISVLAHRGYWLHPAERNSLAAFKRAFGRGYGAEIDVRDLDGELVVSHDPPRRGALTLEAVVTALQASGSDGMLGINVKADGLQDSLADALAKVDQGRWFAFDMSVPDALDYVRRGLPTFTRHSDVEPDPVLLQDASGVWLDDFGGGWLGEEHVVAHLDAGRRVAVVSPELHGRDHGPAWEQWRRWDAWDEPDLWLCTDHPSDAEVVFS